MLANVGMMLLGALLVVVGVLAGAVGDRIRGNRAARASAGTSPRKVAQVSDHAKAEPMELGDLGRDVVATLIASGFSKDAATQATLACPGTTRSTVESWTRAALGQCSPLRRTA